MEGQISKSPNTDSNFCLSDSPVMRYLSFRIVKSSINILYDSLRKFSKHGESFNSRPFSLGVCNLFGLHIMSGAGCIQHA